MRSAAPPAGSASSSGRGSAAAAAREWIEDAWFDLLRQLAWWVGARAGLRRGARIWRATATSAEPDSSTSARAYPWCPRAAGRRSRGPGSSARCAAGTAPPRRCPPGRIISSAATCSLTNSVIGVSTNAGRERRHLDPLAGDLLLGRLAEADHRRLGRRVDREPRLAGLAGDRGRVDDQRLAVLGAGLAQHRQALARHQDHRAQVDPELHVEVLGRRARPSPRRSRPRRC